MIIARFLSRSCAKVRKKGLTPALSFGEGVKYVR